MDEPREASGLLEDVADLDLDLDRGLPESDLDVDEDADAGDARDSVFGVRTLMVTTSEVSRMVCAGG